MTLCLNDGEGALPPPRAPVGPPRKLPPRLASMPRTPPDHYASVRVTLGVGKYIGHP